jgi:hypothetical protein
MSCVHGREIDGEPHAIEAPDRPMIRKAIPRIEGPCFTGAEFARGVEALHRNLNPRKRYCPIRFCAPTPACVLDIIGRRGIPDLDGKIEYYLAAGGVGAGINFSSDRIAKVIRRKVRPGSSCGPLLAHQLRQSQCLLRHGASSALEWIERS